MDDLAQLTGLLDSLARRGIAIEVMPGAKLRLNGLREEITDADKAAVTALKPRLLSYLGPPLDEYVQWNPTIARTHLLAATINAQLAWDRAWAQYEVLLTEAHAAYHAEDLAAVQAVCTRLRAHVERFRRYLGEE